MKRLSVLIAGLVAVCLAGNVQAACELDGMARLPVTMSGLRPLVAAKINGVDVLFTLDSGAFYSSITPGNAAQYKLPESMAPFGFSVSGVGGSADAAIATVKHFGLAGAELRNISFLVAGSEVGGSSVGLLGQNVLSLADVEYDLADGMVRLVQPRGCGNAALAYWAKDLPWNMIHIQAVSSSQRHTRGQALVNGAPIEVTFDTGAATSVLGLSAARRAGLHPDGPGVRPAGYIIGIGRRRMQAWRAPIASFQIGGETIKNTELLISDIGGETDMLLGADFFLSHHVYVANSQAKLYFTYSGGPVFKLDTQSWPAASEVAAPAEPTDADGFSRRGAAFAARRDYDKALADFTRATELQPAEPRYLQQRAEMHIALHQPFLAMADLDAALKLKPDDPELHVSRVAMRIAGHDRQGALADLDAAAQVAPKEADLRLRMGQLYLDIDAFEPAVEQFSLWLPIHPDDVRRSVALNGRCWARALVGRELDQALSDCNEAVRLVRDAAGPLESRGLVHLRRGEYDKAIADDGAALMRNPKLAMAQYGRGLAEEKVGEVVRGQADVAAAVAMAPRLPARAAKLGLVDVSLPPTTSKSP